MGIHVACAGCGKALRAKDEHAGMRLKCPGCGQLVTVPGRASAAPATAAAGAQPPAHSDARRAQGKAKNPSKPAAATPPAASMGQAAMAPEHECFCFETPTPASASMGQAGPAKARKRYWRWPWIAGGSGVLGVLGVVVIVLLVKAGGGSSGPDTSVVEHPAKPSGKFTKNTSEAEQASVRPADGVWAGVGQPKWGKYKFFFLVKNGKIEGAFVIYEFESTVGRAPLKVSIQGGAVTLKYEYGSSNLKLTGKFTTATEARGEATLNIPGVRGRSPPDVTVTGPWTARPDAELSRLGWNGVPETHEQVHR